MWSVLHTTKVHFSRSVVQGSKKGKEFKQKKKKERKNCQIKKLTEACHKCDIFPEKYKASEFYCSQPHISRTDNCSWDYGSKCI